MVDRYVSLQLLLTYYRPYVSRSVPGNVCLHEGLYSVDIRNGTESG